MRLESLARDDRYSSNHDIVLLYAYGLFNLSKKQDTAEAAATIVRLESLARDDRYSNNHDIMLTFASALLKLGFIKYQMGALKDAGDAFLDAYKLVGSVAGVNLAYMVRRHEYDVTGISVEEMLEAALRDSEAFATMNYALYISINSGNWTDADKILETLSMESVKEIFPWWESLFNSGDLEGLLVNVWLERHGKVGTRLLKYPQEHYHSLRQKYEGIPAWIVEKNLD